ncbi:MAG: phosphotransferase enzyme family protein [Pseudomonadota bacterium]
MDQSAIEAFSPAVKAGIFGRLGVVADKTTDLGGFESFVFLRQDTNTILRITHVGHRTRDELLGEVEFVHFLARGNASVCLPVYPDGESLAVEIGDFIVTEFQRAPGQTITHTDWQPVLFEEWGRSLGQFHRLAKTYVPGSPAWRRQDWHTDPNFNFEGRLPADQPGVLAMGQRYRGMLEHLVTDTSTYGLIHGDAHAGNFFHDNGRLTFFDFDDCGYCWFGYDAATVLFSAVFQPWIENSEAGRHQAAEDFLLPFLTGYERESSVDGLLLGDFPLFLKVRELSLYGVIHSFLDVNQLDDYPARFMAGRQERIERDLPFLELDFL